jgi:hypothetical protein
MRQALHIFRKDVRFLWIEIVVVIGLTAIATWSLARDQAWGGMGALQVVSWWFLIAAAIYKEPLVGDSQFWVTRPYDWKSLAAAKLLLIFTVITVPQFLSDVTVVAAHGLWPAASSLLLRQLVSTGLYVLPAAAIATVTRHRGQMGLTILTTGLVVAAAGMMVGFRMGHGSMEWMRGALIVTILASAGAAVLAWQYGQRRTAAARTALVATAGVCVACLLAAPVGGAIALLAYVPEPRELRAAQLCSPCSAPDAQKVAERYPIRIEGLPEGMKVEPELLELKVDGRNYGRELRGGGQWFTDGPRWVDRALDLALAHGSQPRPVQLTVSLVMTVYRAENAELARDGRLHPVPAIGQCSIDRNDPESFFLHCRTAGYPAAQIQANGQTFFGEQYPYRAMFVSEPIFETSTYFWSSKSMAGDDAPMRLTIEQPIARIRRNLTIEHFHRKP